MFRSSTEAANPLEPAIVKATNESLTQDNWEYILDACDQVSADPEDGAQNAMLAIEKRLKMKDGNVLLRTFSLITALAENCGSKMKQEIATRKFCNHLKDMLNDRHIYLPIKVKIVEMIDQLSKSFANDPSLRIVRDTYKDIKLSHPDLVTNYQPQKPQKHEMTDADRLKEEEELDLALKLSLQEYESRQGPSSYSQPVQTQLSQLQQQLQQLQSSPVESQGNNVPVSENNNSTIANVSRVKALYDLTSHEPDELSFKKGDVIVVIESVYRDWWRGSLRGKIGIFPLNYVTPLKEPTTEELLQELKQEQLLLTKSTEVEKLLSLLSNFSTRLINNKVSNEELSSMVQDAQLSSFYNDVVSLRPELVKLIEKYSTKKDEMVALNKKLVDSERLYNELMESSFNRFMNSRQRVPQQQQQQQQQNPQYSQQPPRTTFQQQSQYGQQSSSSSTPTQPQTLMNNSLAEALFQNQFQFAQQTGQQQTGAYSASQPYYPSQQQQPQSPFNAGAQQMSGSPAGSSALPPYPTSFQSPQQAKPASSNAPPYPNYGI